MSKRPRTFKLRALHSQDKYGVAGKNCQEVLLKGCQKFQLPISGCRLCLYEDGTELTEGYFQRLPDNTELMLLTPGQAWQGCLESRFRNKSSYLRYSCESRIRSYLKEVNAHASTLDPQPRAEYLKIIGQMCEKLKSERYNGSYFDRRDKVRERLCTAEGWFSCQGPFDLDACLSKHSINPYSNRESRILFSTWNLDHKIEKKRTIVPTLTEAVAEQDGREVDWEYFYSLLFTSNNLKLVHIACHKKSSHNLSCDETRIYKPKKQVVRKRAARRRQ
ncbi:DNA fragmentation factor subunit beta-like isoform X2 [Vombatus ursinus]|uniref:DNA fragmentation factor subunit beta isoform X2 n=1 Tax=Vombatus ursinus TaxID=29139 RepID=UPI000FFD5DCA|nr:DNA fragmentation factor subunit beta isoform X2 [Vombatus ursinus]XP_027699707.1 DNA fragmentation factor subunit beta-like isoform X2 [Vombatus ursinus]